MELFTVGPCRILRLRKGSLRPGSDGDVTVLDVSRTVTVEPSGFLSKSANTPFAGWKLRGAPVMTVLAGRVIHDAR